MSFGLLSCWGMRYLLVILLFFCCDWICCLDDCGYDWGDDWYIGIDIDVDVYWYGDLVECEVIWSEVDEVVCEVEYGDDFVVWVFEKIGEFDECGIEGGVGVGIGCVGIGKCY